MPFEPTQAGLQAYIDQQFKSHPYNKYTFLRNTQNSNTVRVRRKRLRKSLKQPGQKNAGAKSNPSKKRINFKQLARSASRNMNDSENPAKFNYLAKQKDIYKLQSKKIKKLFRRFMNGSNYLDSGEVRN